MKRYLKNYLTTFFILNIIFIIILVLLRARTLPFLRFEIAILLIAIFFSFAVWIFRFEKGNSVINVILGYIAIIPGILIMQSLFREHLTRLTWLIYIILVVIGIIYGIVVFVVSKKYQDEVKELNRLLEEKNQEK